MNFDLVVERIPTQTGNYVVDLSWTHVRSVRGYNIYRAESPTDDPNSWRKINSKEIHVNYHQDRGYLGDPVANARVTWYYKLIPVSYAGVEYPLSQSQSETFQAPLYGMQKFVAATIRSRTALQLDPSGFSAAEVVHFMVRKWAGTYCDCIDVRTRKVDANCASCFGIGYSSGFELIENVYCRVRSNQRRIASTSGGITVEENTTGVIATYPRLTDGDVIVRRHNERFYIRDVKQRKIQGYITAQTFNLEKMQLSDTKYRMPAPRLFVPSDQPGAISPNVLP